VIRVRRGDEGPLRHDVGKLRIARDLPLTADGLAFARARGRICAWVHASPDDDPCGKRITGSHAVAEGIELERPHSLCLRSTADGLKRSEERGSARAYAQKAAPIEPGCWRAVLEGSVNGQSISGDRVRSLRARQYARRKIFTRRFAHALQVNAFGDSLVELP
jgi:hypothetical protein